MTGRILPLKTTALALVAALAACGAPKSMPAGGAIGDQVQAAIAGGKGAFSHEPLDRLMREGTVDGFVDYGYFHENRKSLDAYLETVARADLAGLSGPHLKALLINAYNALTIRSILDHPGVTSIREIEGVWKTVQHKVGGFDVTLDEIEHNLLRPYYRDPRIHFALNCASVSCAPLPPWAFTGEALDRQLQERSRAYLSDPAKISVEGETLVAPKYFTWFADDFTGEGWSPRADTVAEFIALYADPQVAVFIARSQGEPTLRFTEYNWALNQAKSGP